VNQDKFKLTKEQHKTAVEFIQWCVAARGGFPDIHAVDHHDAGSTVYVNNPESPDAWRFLVTPLGPGQTQL
jgi:hypothetical protein